MICGWLKMWMWNHGYEGRAVGLEHPQVLVSVVSPETNPPQIPRDGCLCIYIAIYLYLPIYTII